MAGILITGFTPFDGRAVNGSWIAAQSYKNASKLQIPVVWGQPMPLLQEEIERSQPDIIISLGEGKVGQFTVETRAQNQRKHRKDNLSQYPDGDILSDGPEAVEASVDAATLVTRLAEQNIPIIESQDAGQFLCEETLYCLEYLKLQYTHVRLVTFIHLPPFGSSVNYLGNPEDVNQALLEDFTQRLVNTVVSLDALASHQTQNRG